jgi:hypothetical protein
MSGIRRALVTAALTVLTVVAGGALVQPAAWAAQEYRASFSHEHAASIRDVFARGDDLCNLGFMATGAGVGLATGGAGVAVGTGLGVAADAFGLLCGRSDPKMRAAADEAFFRKCGFDMYFTDGPRSFDGTRRYVVCP